MSGDPVIEFFDDDKPEAQPIKLEKKNETSPVIKSSGKKTSVSLKSGNNSIKLSLPGDSRIWALASVLFILLIGASIFTHGFKDVTGFFAAPVGANSTSINLPVANSSAPVISLTLLVDSNCTQCYNPVQVHGTVLAQAGVNLNSTTRILDIHSAQGQALIQKYNITSVPTFLAPPELATGYPNVMSQFLVNFGTLENDGWYVFRSNDAIGQPYENLSTGKVVGLPPSISELSAGGHSIGPGNASVTVVEFADFECPYCGAEEGTNQAAITALQDPTQGDPNWTAAVPTLVTMAKAGLINYVFMQDPLAIHANAFNASLAAECASEQGQFWEYHDKLFANQNALTPSDLESYASQLGLNTTQFDSCYNSQKYASKIQNDINIATSAGVTGTPYFFINNLTLPGAYPLSTVQQVIAQAQLQ